MSHVMANGRPCGRPDGHSGRHYPLRRKLRIEDKLCGHSECTGVHSSGYARSEMCPRAVERDRKRSNEWRRAHPDRANEAKRRYRERHPERLREQAVAWHPRHPTYFRERRLRQKRLPYVYAILIGSRLKIGKSTDSYEQQRSHTASAYQKRGLGEANRAEAQMIWHNRGDADLEIYLQWQAGRIWAPLTGGTRHSEWFDVADVPADLIVKKLRRWRDVAEIPAEEDE